MLRKLTVLATMLTVVGLMSAHGYGRSEGEIRLDTKSNTVGLDAMVECHYNRNTNRVICKVGSKEVKKFDNVREVKQHPGTRRSNKNYIGMYGRAEGPGMGEYTYIYAE